MARDYGDITAADFEHVLDPAFKKMRDQITPAKFEAILAQLTGNCDHLTEADLRVMLSRLSTAIGL
jgi:uncharacterized protein (DUF2267 family)